MTVYIVSVICLVFILLFTAAIDPIDGVSPSTC